MLLHRLSHVQIDNANHPRPATLSFPRLRRDELANVGIVIDTGAWFAATFLRRVRLPVDCKRSKNLPSSQYTSLTLLGSLSLSTKIGVMLMMRTMKCITNASVEMTC